ncbi:MAG: exonuclease SbcCD subunit D [Capsulimonadales bacterium]|nr:exonuclease SbcCD subunit D [Capsulimonadales bacterium]
MSSFPETPADRVRVFHFGDVHLGVETYGKYNPETGLNTRLEDFDRSLKQAVERALEAEADLAVFAGDAYKARDPNQTHQKLFAASLKRLTDAGVPVALLVGNHDIPNTRGRAHALEIYGLLGGAGVTILQSPETVRIATRKGTVLVAGMPYLTRSRVLAQEEARAKSVEEVALLIRDRYIDYIAELGREVAQYPHYLAILTGHFTLSEARLGVGTQGFLLNPNEPQVPVSAVALPNFDYVAMGHVHRHQDMHQGAQPPVVYCGSIDRIDYGERVEDKGFVLADVRKGYAAFKHVAVKTRPFLQIEADAMNSEDPTRAILEEIATHPITGSIVKLSYRVGADRAALVRQDEIRKALGAAHLIVAISREASGNAALTRSEGFSEALTPEKALELYIETQPRLTARRDELLAAARPLIDSLNSAAD